jgi:hypothetical protein
MAVTAVTGGLLGGLVAALLALQGPDPEPPAAAPVAAAVEDGPGVSVLPWMHGTNEELLEAARLAVKRSPSPAVQRLASEILDEAPARNAALRDVADEEERRAASPPAGTEDAAPVAVAPPTGPGRPDARTYPLRREPRLDVLWEAPAERFDAIFLAAVVRLAERSIHTLTEALPGAPPRVQEVLRPNLKAMFDHRARARLLLRELPAPAAARP